MAEKKVVLGNYSYPAADVTWLAKSWEYLVSTIEYPTKTFALHALNALTTSYFRGQGKRGFEKWGWEMAALDIIIIRRVASDEAKEIWFPKLTKFGFADMENAVAILKEKGGFHNV